MQSVEEQVYHGGVVGGGPATRSTPPIMATLGAAVARNLAPRYRQRNAPSNAANVVIMMGETAQCSLVNGSRGAEAALSLRLERKSTA